MAPAATAANANKGGGVQGSVNKGGQEGRTRMRAGECGGYGWVPGGSNEHGGCMNKHERVWGVWTGTRGQGTRGQGHITWPLPLFFVLYYLFF